MQTPTVQPDMATLPRCGPEGTSGNQAGWSCAVGQSLTAKAGGREQCASHARRRLGIASSFSTLRGWSSTRACRLEEATESPA
jgi:hypothetical protein